MKKKSEFRKAIEAEAFNQMAEGYLSKFQEEPPLKEMEDVGKKLLLLIKHMASVSEKHPSREFSIIRTKLDEASLWLFQHYKDLEYKKSKKEKA